MLLSSAAKVQKKSQSTVVVPWDLMIIKGKYARSLGWFPLATDGRYDGTFLSCYTFTIVTQGWLTILHNNQEMTMHEGDLYTDSGKENKTDKADIC